MCDMAEINTFIQECSAFVTCSGLNVVVQWLSHVQLIVAPWTAVHQASLSFTISWSLLRLMTIELVMSSNHLILCHSLLLLPSIFPSIRIFSNELAKISGGQSIGPSVSASVLPMNIQGWFPLGWLVWSPCFPRNSQESSPAQFKSISSSELSFLYFFSFFRFNLIF